MQIRMKGATTRIVQVRLRVRLGFEELLKQIRIKEYRRVCNTQVLEDGQKFLSVLTGSTRKLVDQLLLQPLFVLLLGALLQQLV